MEGDAVERTGVLTVFELGLRDGGTERHVPQRGGLGGVGLAAGQVAQKRALRHRSGRVADRGVERGPVDREADPAPDLLERLLVAFGEPVAQLHEVAPGDGEPALARLTRLARLACPVRLACLVRRLEAGVVRQRGVAADAEVVLHAALGRQPVVVPPHRVEDLPAAHPPKARHRVGVGVGEHVPDVQRAADRRRRRVDRIDLGARLRAVEAVDMAVGPAAYPLVLQTGQCGLLGDGCGMTLFGHGNKDIDHRTAAVLRWPPCLALCGVGGCAEGGAAVR
jgi:hypothetical protein